MAKRTATKPKTTVLKENEAATPPVEAPQVPVSDGGGGDFFSPGDMKSGLDDFVKHMKTPREKVEAPAVHFGDEEEEEGPLGEVDPLAEVEQGTLSHFDYDEEHEKTAEFILMTMDQAFSFVGGMYSGQPAEKYNRFSGKKRPTEYQLSVTAAMLKKYQTKLSLEWMFATIIVMAFAPTFREAQKDRTEAKRKQMREEEARRVAMMRGQIIPEA